MYGLAIHTTTPNLGIAIANFADDNHRWQTWHVGRDLFSQMHARLAEFIQPQTWQDISFLAIAKGPGSFTGTRIGVVTARVLAQQLGIPIFAISTLAGLAKAYWQQFPSIPLETDIAVQMPARGDRLFTAIYKPSPKTGTLTTLLADQVTTWETWQKTLSAWSSHYHLVRGENEENIAKSVEALLNLAYCHWQQGEKPTWEQATPFYGYKPY